MSLPDGLSTAEDRRVLRKAGCEVKALKLLPYLQTQNALSTKKKNNMSLSVSTQALVPFVRLD